MPARLSAFVIWALVAATASFWALRLAVHAPAAPAHVVAIADGLTASGDLTRLLGAPPVAATVVAAAPEAASRFRLLGIVAPREQESHRGVALIAIDGKPARAFPVGATVDGDLVLKSVSLRKAAIGPAEGRQTLVLEVPRLPVAATGTLPPPGFASPAVTPAAQSGQIPGTVPVLPTGGGAAPVPSAPPNSVAPAFPAPLPSGMPPGTVTREGNPAQ